MLRIAVWLTDALHRAHTEEEGQDTFEYLLVLGVLVVAVVGLAVAAPGIITAVITGVRNAIATLPGMAGVAA